MEYERLEPFGSWRDNWHAAMIASAIANAFRKKGAPPIGMHEFMYADPETAQEEKDKELIAFLSGFGKGK